MDTEKTENLSQSETQEAQPENQTSVNETSTAITRDDLNKIKEEAKAEALNQYKGIQRVIDKVQRENKTLKEQLSKIQSQPADLDAVYETLESNARAAGDTEAAAKIAILRDAEAKRKQNSAATSKFIEQDRIIQEEREKLEVRMNEAGLDPDDPKFDRVWAEFKVAANTDGNFTEANRLLDKRIGKKAEEKAEVKAVETEKQMRERIEREVLEKHGLLTPEKTHPAGDKESIEQLMTKDTRRMSLAELNEHQKKLNSAMHSRNPYFK